MHSIKYDENFLQCKENSLKEYKYHYQYIKIQIFGLIIPVSDLKQCTDVERILVFPSQIYKLLRFTKMSYWMSRNHRQSSHEPRQSQLFCLSTFLLCKYRGISIPYSSR